MSKELSPAEKAWEDFKKYCAYYKHTTLLAIFTAGFSAGARTPGQKRRDAEIDEFNQGYEAQMAGVAYEDEPIDTQHDQWRVGWAWGAFDGMRKKLAKLEAEAKDV